MQEPAILEKGPIAGEVEPLNIDSKSTGARVEQSY